MANLQAACYSAVAQHASIQWLFHPKSNVSLDLRLHCTSLILHANKQASVTHDVHVSACVSVARARPVVVAPKNTAH